MYRCTAIGTLPGSKFYVALMCIYVVWHASPIFTSRLHGLVCIDVRLLVPFLGPRSMLHQCAFMLFGMLHQCLLCIYVVWYDSPMLFAVHTNIWYCLTSLANVDVQMSVPFLGPFSICFPNVTCCSCCSYQHLVLFDKLGQC